MQVGVIGLGKMGLNLSLNMVDHDVKVFGYDLNITDEMKQTHDQIQFSESLEELVKSLSKPRIVWLMVPAGEATDTVVDSMCRLLEEDDVVIDGGNSRYTDTLEHYKKLKHQNIHMLDCGTSGGTYGARHGACLMVGGEREIYDRVEPLFKAIAIEDGYDYMGKSGAGHYVKMVHNGIEYGMMQAISEGFDVLEASQYQLDYEAVSKVWAHGSIIEGLLLRMVESAFKKDPKLTAIKGRIDDSGEGKWTVEEALKLDVSTPVIAQSLFTRYKSRDEKRFAEKLIAAMRNEFGGHKVYKE
ncbi:MAG: decarboxylating 6-phosphogluconate dehydrogenase [Candidatus Izemoplasma sp.]|nr:decarboxylating 6-phosphogluconate dehydrogenase [Candidatus Izemoplasma sp.]